MAYKAERFISDLDKVAKARQEFSGFLSGIADTLTEAEQIGEIASGKLGRCVWRSKNTCSTKSLPGA